MVAPLTGDAKTRKVATSSDCAFLVLYYQLMRICYGIMGIYSQSLEYIVIIYVGIRYQILFGWYFKAVELDGFGSYPPTTWKCRIFIQL